MKKLLGSQQEYSLVVDIAHKLGSGSFAEVYKGLNLQTNQPVAIKVIDLNRASPRELKYLRQEIQTMRRLNHPNLVKLLHYQVGIFFHFFSSFRVVMIFIHLESRL
jgi:serine/threonine protein kinase